MSFWTICPDKFNLSVLFFLCLLTRETVSFRGENYELDLLTLKFFDETFVYMHFSS